MPTIDYGGNDIIVGTIKTGATAPGQAGTDLSSVEFAALDAATNANAGTGKAVITGTSGALTIPGVLTNPGGYTSTSGTTSYTATAVPAGGTTGIGWKTSSTANFGIFFGSGLPTLSAAQGSLYLRTDGSTIATRLYVNTNGTTGWTNVTTAT